jgi:signal transduction histidine kinase
MNWKRSSVRFLESQSKGWLMGEAVFLVAVVGVFDYATGYEVAFFPFYSIPILLALWFCGTNEAILVYVLSAVAWWCADRATGHVYSHEWLRTWDTIVRLMFFCLVVMAGSTFRNQRNANRARIALLERSQKLEQEIISISECERQRIGRDLHDSLGQYLAAVGFAADLLKNDLARESHFAAGSAGEIATLIRDAVVRARDLARGLSPVDRDEGGLESALEEFAGSVSRLTGIPCSFKMNGALGLCDNARAVHLFRIAQEAVNNATKHARAKSIVISMEAGNGVLLLRISDDGIGFKPDNSFDRGGMGLNIMRYRARMIEGRFHIQSNSPGGTVVSCEVTGRAFGELTGNS